MHSSSAACVLGEARLTSSTSSRFANTGPGRNSNSLTFWLNTLTPVTSEGSRSGVNWRRENEQSSERAIAFASIVFPTPGKSSMIRWPSLTRQSVQSRSVSSGACTTRARFETTLSATRAASSTGRAGCSLASISGLQYPLGLVENHARDRRLRRLGHRLLAARRDEDDFVVGDRKSV